MCLEKEKVYYVSECYLIRFVFLYGFKFSEMFYKSVLMIGMCLWVLIFWMEVVCNKDGFWVLLGVVFFDRYFKCVFV